MAAVYSSRKLVYCGQSSERRKELVVLEKSVTRRHQRGGRVKKRVKRRRRCVEGRNVAKACARMRFVVSVLVDRMAKSERASPF